MNLTESKDLTKLINKIISYLNNLGNSKKQKIALKVIYKKITEMLEELD